MQPLISSTDLQLLTTHQVKVEVEDKKYGIIILQNRRLKVSLLSRKSGEKDDQWQLAPLKEEQLKETASKIAVMLLKKELLEAKATQSLNFKIEQPGITRLVDNTLYKHEDGGDTKNTRPDYDALISYLKNSATSDAPPQEAATPGVPPKEDLKKDNTAATAAVDDKATIKDDTVAKKIDDKVILDAAVDDKAIVKDEKLRKEQEETEKLRKQQEEAQKAETLRKEQEETEKLRKQQEEVQKAETLRKEQEEIEKLRKEQEAALKDLGDVKETTQKEDGVSQKEEDYAIIIEEQPSIISTDIASPGVEKKEVQAKKSPAIKRANSFIFGRNTTSPIPRPLSTFPFGTPHPLSTFPLGTPWWKKSEQKETQEEVSTDEKEKKEKELSNRASIIHHGRVVNPLDERSSRGLQDALPDSPSRQTSQSSQRLPPSLFSKNWSKKKSKFFNEDPLILPDNDAAIMHKHWKDFQQERARLKQEQKVKSASQPKLPSLPSSKPVASSRSTDDEYIHRVMDLAGNPFV